MWHVVASLTLGRLLLGAVNTLSTSSQIPVERARRCGDLSSQEDINSIPQEDANSILQVHASIPKPSSGNQSNYAAVELAVSRGMCPEHGARLYGLNSVGHAFTPECRGDECGLRLPSSWSRFMNGKIPEILHVDYSKEIIKGKRWFNPSVVKLPLHLAEMFPNGRYLAIGNLVPAPKAFPPNGTHALVLNSEFEPIAESRLDVRRAQYGNGDNITEIMHRLVADGRLLVDHNGHILIGFTPYSIGMIPNTHRHEGLRFWECHEFVGIVRSSKLSDGSLDASVDFHEMRMLDAPRVRPDDCLKNLAFISKPSGQIDVIVYVHPTRIAQFDFADLRGDKANKSAYVTPLVLKSLRSVNQSRTVPWLGAIMYNKNHAGKDYISFMHNGPHPIWVEELQEYLGIGHVARGLGDIPGGCYEHLHNHHYTNLFFTLSSGPNFHIRRVSKREWCMPNSDHPGDCDSMQFVSGLVRDGDHFHVAYGVHDVAAFIMRVSVQSVLDSLQAFDSIGQSNPA